MVIDALFLVTTTIYVCMYVATSVSFWQPRPAPAHQRDSLWDMLLGTQDGELLEVTKRVGLEILAGNHAMLLPISSFTTMTMMTMMTMMLMLFGNLCVFPSPLAQLSSALLVDKLLGLSKWAPGLSAGNERFLFFIFIFYSIVFFF